MSPRHLRSVFDVPVEPRSDGGEDRLQTASVSSEIRPVIRSTDPALPVTGTQTMDDTVSTSLPQRRFQLMLMLLLGAAAALLAGLGVYGVASHAVTQRTSEFGVRMALGANARSIHNMVVKQALRPVLIGVALGLVASAGTTRLIRGHAVRNVTRVGPSSFATVAAFLAIVALAASFLPAGVRRVSIQSRPFGTFDCLPEIPNRGTSGSV
jgi:ABC-type antimicrobial peptide transport system permease subunit